jgi:ketosteroid isomerase-like protein
MARYIRSEAMKTLLRTASVIFLLLTWAMGQQSQSAASTNSTKSADPALEKRWQEYADALTKRDFATLDKIWAPDYTFVNPQGQLVTKAERMANLKSGATEFKAINPQRERLAVHGNMAVDIGRVTLEGTKYAGQESSGEYRYMNVWRKISGQWQMLANQITLIKK